MRGAEGANERKYKKNINLMWNDLCEICVYIEQGKKNENASNSKST